MLRRHPYRRMTPARLRHLGHRFVRSRWSKSVAFLLALAAVQPLIAVLLLAPGARLPLDFLTTPAGITASAASCGWTEPPRTYPEGLRWSCVAVGWRDGDTLAAKCDNQEGTVSIRLRGVDTDERGETRYEAARDELHRRTVGQDLAVLPHHPSHRRVVADVLAGGVNVGVAMDAAGWSKRDCPKR